MQSPFSKIKPERVMFFGGILLISIGVGFHDRGAGLACAGALMLLSLKPFWGWLK